MSINISTEQQVATAQHEESRVRVTILGSRFSLSKEHAIELARQLLDAAGRIQSEEDDDA